jgi:hypothetical protein
MDRHPPPPDADLLPPPDPAAVVKVVASGVATVAAAAALGLALDLSGNGGPSFLSTARLVLVAAGVLVAGGGLSARPGLPAAWLLAGVAGVLARFGLPEHWDSARMVVTVGGVVGFLGAGLAAMSRGWRYGLISAAAVVHFGGILCAVTWPDPTPWITQQVGTRVYLPYLMFMYLRNAYHFYSPEPGPASHLFILIEYQEKDPKTGKPLAEWKTLPNRAKDWKDPLGLTYYRRLALTEQVSQTLPETGGPLTFEKRDVVERRRKAAGDLGGFNDYPRIPLYEELDPVFNQYRMPRPDITRYLLPSYARHVITEAEGKGRSVASVKVYRLEHRLLSVRGFAHGGRYNSPHHPTTFRPYFLGEFKLDRATGQAELADPQDPMLYWLVPIVPRTPGPGDPDGRDYEDFMSRHAGYSYNWEARTP